MARSQGILNQNSTSVSPTGEQKSEIKIENFKRRFKRWMTYVDWIAVKKVWHWLLFTVIFAGVPTLIARALKFLERVDPDTVVVPFDWFLLIGNGHLLPMVAAISMTVLSEGIQAKRIGTNSIFTFLLVLVPMVLYAYVAGVDPLRYDHQQIAIFSLFAWILSVISGVPSLYLYWSTK